MGKAEIAIAKSIALYLLHASSQSSFHLHLTREFARLFNFSSTHAEIAQDNQSISLSTLLAERERRSQAWTK